MYSINVRFFPPLCFFSITEVWINAVFSLTRCWWLFLFFKIFIYLFIYFWLRWVFVAACGLSVVAASGDYSWLQWAGFSLWWLLLLRSMGSRCVGSVVVAHGLSCSTACGIFPDRARTHVPCIGRQILNHCATREVPWWLFWRGKYHASGLF